MSEREGSDYWMPKILLTRLKVILAAHFVFLHSVYSEVDDYPHECRTGNILKLNSRSFQKRVLSTTGDGILWFGEEQWEMLCGYLDYLSEGGIRMEFDVENCKQDSPNCAVGPIQ